MKPTRRLSAFTAPTLAFCASILASIGCSEDEGASPKSGALKVYLSSEYGFVATFDEEKEEATGYAVVGGRCWVQPVPQEVWWMAPRDENVMDFDYMGQKDPGMPFLRVDTLEDACPSGIIMTSLEEDFAFDPALEFELFQQTFAEHYAFFDLREVDWDLQVLEAEAALAEVAGPEDFFAVLSSSVAPLGDGHIVIQAGDDLVFNQNRRADIVTRLSEEAAQSPDAPTEGLDEFVGQYVEEQMSIMGGALEGHFTADSAEGTLEDPLMWATVENGEARYGYFRLTTFSNLVEGSMEDNVNALQAAFDTALESWGEVEGVIIDVRINDGGWDVLGRALASRFVEDETVVYRKRVYSQGEWTQPQPITVTPHEGARYSGPVVVLSSATTISAAETFVLSMRTLDQVTIVGEPTYGILSDSLPKFLPSGIFFSLSNEEYSSPEGDVFELEGVPPDVEVEVFSLVDRQEGRDGSLQAAFSTFEAANE